MPMYVLEIAVLPSTVSLWSIKGKEPLKSQCAGSSFHAGGRNGAVVFCIHSTLLLAEFM